METQTHGEKSYEDRGRDWRDGTTSPGHWSTRAARGQEGPPLKPRREPDFRLLASGGARGQSSAVFSPPACGHFWQQLREMNSPSLTFMVGAPPRPSQQAAQKVPSACDAVPAAAFPVLYCTNTLKELLDVRDRVDSETVGINKTQSCPKDTQFNAPEKPTNQRACTQGDAGLCNRSQELLMRCLCVLFMYQFVSFWTC